MSNAGDFSWSWILKDFIQVQKKGMKICRRMCTSSIKRQIRRFHVVVVKWTSRKLTKKRDARAELLFWSLNLLFFWSRRCGRRRSCLSSLMFRVVTLLANSAQPQQRQKRENNQNRISERAAHLVAGFLTAFAPQKLSNMIEMAIRSSLSQWRSLPLRFRREIRGSLYFVENARWLDIGPGPFLRAKMGPSYPNRQDSRA